MQNVINYEDFFKFKLHVPFAKVKNYSLKDFLTELQQEQIIPLVILTDTSNPVFQRFVLDFKPSVRNKIDTIVLAIYYPQNTFLT